MYSSIQIQWTSFVNLLKTTAHVDWNINDMMIVLNKVAMFHWSLWNTFLQISSTHHWMCGKHMSHDDVIKWKHFPRYWPFVRGIHQWPVNSPHKGQWRCCLMYSLTSAWMNDCVNNPGDLRRHRAHHDVTVIMSAVISRHDDVIKWKHFPRYWPFVRGIPRQRPVTRSFDVFFDLCLIKRLSKQSQGWWFETPTGSLWRRCNGNELNC